jgi:hypothetical protein
MNKDSRMDEAPATLATADIATILKVLPQHYPFLMVDRIINMRGDEFARALWRAGAFSRSSRRRP